MKKLIFIIIIIFLQLTSLSATELYSFSMIGLGIETYLIPEGEDNHFGPVNGIYVHFNMYFNWYFAKGRSFGVSPHLGFGGDSEPAIKSGIQLTVRQDFYNFAIEPYIGILQPMYFNFGNSITYDDDSLFLTNLSVTRFEAGLLFDLPPFWYISIAAQRNLISSLPETRYIVGFGIRGETR